MMKLLKKDISDEEDEEELKIKYNLNDSQWIKEQNGQKIDAVDQNNVQENAEINNNIVNVRRKPMKQDTIIEGVDE